MNTKVKKSMKIAAAAVFILALAMNVSMSLNNPFASVANTVIAQTTSQPDTGTLKGPMCSDPSGTIYCCKGSNGTCSAGAICTSCT